MLSALTRHGGPASRAALRAASTGPPCTRGASACWQQLNNSYRDAHASWSPLALVAGAAAIAGAQKSGASGCDDHQRQSLRRDTEKTDSSVIKIKVDRDMPSLNSEAGLLLRDHNISVKNLYSSKDGSGATIHRYTVQDEATGKGVSTSKLEEIQTAFKKIQDVECDASHWPVFTRAKVSEHTTAETGIWVSYKDGVYDITSFISNHPGGHDKIMLAAGKAIDPFWRIYQQHEGRGNALKALADMRIGDLADPPLPSTDDDPYNADPDRHPGLIFHNNKPCNAELPPELMLDSWMTPNPVWFIRHHHPVPVIDPDEFRLHVEGVGTKPVTLTMEDLKTRFLKREVATTIQCGGNRRGEFNEIEKTSGIAWGCGAISTANWGGVYLREVLMHCAGLTLEGIEARGVKHVVMHGLDSMQASIPIEKALSPFGDVLLAYEMNGEPLPAEHGAPVRLIAPGAVGVRNVKWVGRICASLEEAEGPWQRGAAYKFFASNIKSFDGVDLTEIPSIQDMSVQSSIVSPKPGATVELDDVEVKGFAWSGGGRAIIRVDVSIDNGVTWQTAELGAGKDQNFSRAWAWTFWEASVPVPEHMLGKELVICCRAVDSSCNVQPERAEAIWNLRGLNNNSWHRVRVKHNDD